ncbi:MAG: ferritin family protein [Candidatus Aminicenantes bacterium]|nr:ferritin family protein [Candidatus Aminicenantes bacterium]
MAANKRIDIIKGAILLELKGKALYESVTKTAKVEGVRELFDMLVKEEEKHIRILNKQYSNLQKGEGIDSSELEKEDATVEAAVLSDDIVKGIFGAGYEAAVISAALEFEKNAVAYYSENAEQAESQDEEKLYKWLTEWEKTHMMMLARLDSEIKEQIWYDNQFWPLD